MTNLNIIKKKLAKENRKVSVLDPSKLLADFFNGVVIKLDEEYIYDQGKIRSHGLSSNTTKN